MRKFGREIFVLAGALLALGPGAALSHDLHGIVAERNSLEPEVWTKIQDAVPALAWLNLGPFLSLSAFCFSTDHSFG